MNQSMVKIETINPKTRNLPFKAFVIKLVNKKMNYGLVLSNMKAHTKRIRRGVFSYPYIRNSISYCFQLKIQYPVTDHKIYK